MFQLFMEPPLRSLYRQMDGTQFLFIGHLFPKAHHAER